jgi:hypothetical protein
MRFSKVKEADFQNEGVEEMQDEKINKTLIETSDIHGDPPCDRGVSM